MRPSTSPRFRVRSMPFTMSWVVSPLRAATRNPRISRSRSLEGPSGCGADTALAFIFEPTRFVEEPIDHEVDRNGQKSDGPGRKERRDIAIGDQRGVLADHGAPIGRGRLDPEA